MQLPEELRVMAAVRAAEAFPPNSPLHGAASGFAEFLQPQQIAGITSKFWGSQTSELSVQFLDNPTAACRRMILEAANSWDCRIIFRETSGPGQVRLSRDKSGLYSYLGQDILMVPADRETINFQGWTERTLISEYLRVVPHEFGHTLGFVHEQLRPEVLADILVNETIAWYRDNQGFDEATTRANVLTGLDVRTLMSTPVDQDSIMAYWLATFLTRSGRGFRGGLRLTQSDLDFVDLIYPKANDPAPPVSPPPTSPPPGPISPSPPTPSPPPEPPSPIVPPGPTSPAPLSPDAGPYDLKIGVPSDTFTLLDGTAIRFRFRPKGKHTFVAATASKLALVMELLDATGQVLAKDEDAAGKDGNAMLARTLKPGTYYLRVKGMIPEVIGPFRVKVVAT